MLRWLIFLHRWIGVAVCLVFLLWFPSGIGMMYWRFPGVSAADRLERSPDLDPASIALSPVEAVVAAGADPASAQVRLNTFDGRPVYRVSGGRGGGGGGIIYADTGERQTEVTPEMRDRIAAAWTGRPLADAHMESVEEVDQWTVAGQLRNLRPLYKYSWPSGEQVYVAGATGEVVQYTTRFSRFTAHLSAIPHWLYYTPLRQHQPIWIRIMIWVSLIGTISAIIGIVVGVWLYSPEKKYRRAGSPTRVPYRGPKRWHTIFGLVFGVAAATWAFSGLLSLGPFPIVQRFQALTAPPPGGGGQNVAGILRGRVTLEAFAAAHPRELLARTPQLRVRELQFSSFDGAPLFAATLAGGRTRMIALDGTPIVELDHQRIIDLVKQAAPDPEVVETRLLEQYDWYYLDRTRQRPLPVILAQVNDPAKTRYYIDPQTASVVSSYSSRNWVNRWLYNGLHSLNFPWLYNHRPLWDIVVIIFMVGGTALCATSVVLAWRVLGRKLRLAAAARGRP